MNQSLINTVHSIMIAVLSVLLAVATTQLSTALRMEKLNTEFMLQQQEKIRNLETASLCEHVYIKRVEQLQLDTAKCMEAVAKRVGEREGLKRLEHLMNK